MELKHIKELMTAMGRTGTKRLILKKENFELTLEREDQIAGRLIDSLPVDPEENRHYSQAWRRADQALSRSSEPLTGRLHSPGSSEIQKEDPESIFIPSPMVGTYYNATAPDAPPFIKVGDKIEKNDVVCIIEAMKVMNEIKANVSGVVAEILLDTGQPVEFGTKLFRITE